MGEIKQSARTNFLLLLGGVGGLTLGISSLLGGNVLPGAIAAGAGFASTVTGAHLKGKDENTIGELLEGGASLLQDFDEAFNGASDRIPSMGVPALIRKRLPVLDTLVQKEDPTNWITQAYWDTNHAYIGRKGTFKSTHLKHEWDRWTAAHGLGSSIIIDPHYDIGEEKSIDQWGPGIPRSELAPFVSKDKSSNFSVLEKAWKLLQTRKSKNLKYDKAEWFKLFVDEFQHAFHQEDMEKVNEYVGDLDREGRKYRIRISIALHSAKKEETGLDSSVLWAFTTAVCGNTISDSTTKWPGDWKTKDLAAETNRVLEAAPENRFTTAVIALSSDYPNPPFYGPQVRQLPNRANHLQELVIDPASDLDDLRQKAEAWLSAQEKATWTGMCRQFEMDSRMQKDSDGNYKHDPVKVLREVWEASGNVDEEVQLVQ